MQPFLCLILMYTYRHHGFLYILSPNLENPNRIPNLKTLNPPTKP